MSVTNICGVLVHSRPERSAAVRAALLGVPGVEVHAATPEGRLVVTVEDTAEGLAADTFVRLHEIDGVLSASLVYHHCEYETEPEESRP